MYVRKEESKRIEIELVKVGIEGSELLVDGHILHQPALTHNKTQKNFNSQGTRSRVSPLKKLSYLSHFGLIDAELVISEIPGIVK